MGDETSLTGEEDADTHFGVDVNGGETEYGEHLLGALLQRNVDVVAVFNPEHGFRGTEDAGALEPPFMDQTCYGVDLRSTPIEDIWNAGINPDYLVCAYAAYKETGMKDSFWGQPDEEGRYWIDKLSGSDALRSMVEAGNTAEEIKASWQEDIQSFKEQRKPYQLYSE